MKRQQLEDAISELDLLLENGSPEVEFQRWLENHPVVMAVLNYRDCIPHPNLVSSTSTLIPDFLCRRIDGLWEILELKVADTAIAKPVERRVTFYAEFEQYIAQCHEYAEYFDDSANREAFRTRSGHDVQRRPSSVLVAGRTEGLDRAKIHHLLSRRVPAISHSTYDDLRNVLEFQRAALFGDLEHIQGLSIHLVLSIDPAPGEAPLFVFDIGIEANRNRVSLRVTPEQSLAVDVHDSGGRCHTITIAPSERTFQVGQLFYLSVDVGGGNDCGILLAEVNGTYCSEYTLTNLDVVFDTRAIVLGSDLAGQAHSYVTIAQQAIFTKTLSFEDKSRMRAFIYAKYYRCFTEGLTPPAIQCRGHHFMFGESHPLLASEESRASGRTGLVQPNPKHQPLHIAGDDHTCDPMGY